MIHTPRKKKNKRDEAQKSELEQMREPDKLEEKKLWLKHKEKEKNDR